MEDLFELVDQLLSSPQLKGLVEFNDHLWARFKNKIESEWRERFGWFVGSHYRAFCGQCIYREECHKKGYLCPPFAEYLHREITRWLKDFLLDCYNAVFTEFYYDDGKLKHSEEERGW